MTFSARTERRGQTINQLAAEKHLHKILDKPGRGGVRCLLQAPTWPVGARTDPTVPGTSVYRPETGCQYVSAHCLSSIRSRRKALTAGSMSAFQTHRSFMPNRESFLQRAVSKAPRPDHHPTPESLICRGASDTVLGVLGRMHAVRGCTPIGEVPYFNDRAQAEGLPAWRQATN